jgi:hypothetical protein
MPQTDAEDGGIGLSGASSLDRAGARVWARWTEILVRLHRKNILGLGTGRKDSHFESCCRSKAGY